MKTAIPPDRLKLLLSKKGKKPIWLADQIGTSRAHMSRILNKKSPLTMEWVLKIAKALKVKPHEIAGIHMDKKTASTIDDVAMGSIIGWLMEFSSEAKMKLSQDELGKLTTYVYKQAIEVPLNFDETRYLAYSSIQIKKLLKA
ncbi:MAG: helix-turn-helix transcriptional regulator [Alphaproteobacteria bacterium]